MKILKCVLENYNDRKDGTVSLKLDSLLEVPDSDIAEIRGMRGNIAIAVITDVVDVLEADISTKDIMDNLPDDPFLDTRITPRYENNTKPTAEKRFVRDTGEDVRKKAYKRGTGKVLH